jgi:chemotaxis protein methyltransferase CheR
VIDKDCLAITRFIKETTGITVPEVQKTAVRQFVAKYLEQTGLNGEGYCAHLQSNRSEFDELMQIVTINETYFFREEKHFLFLKDILIPELKGRIPKEPVNIWSASCSSGEEALSLYALFRALMPSGGFTVFGSDISREMLDKFQSGLFRNSAFRGDGNPFHPLIKELAHQTSPLLWNVSSEHIQAIRKLKINLFNDSLDALPPMDIIFLRNTLIYMSPENKTIAIDRIAGKLREGGILILSSSEVPVISHPSLTVVSRGNIYYFQKTDPRSLSQATLKENLKKAVLKKTAAPKAAPVPVPVRKDPPLAQLTEELVCRSIAMMLNNRLYDPSPTEESRIARFILILLKELEENRAGRVLELIEGERKIPPSLEFYLRGYAHYHREEGESSRKNFRRALGYNSRLWPARYYLVKTLEKGSPEKQSLLRALEVQIEEYIGDHRYDYQFLLDGFNAQYFLLIVRDMRKSLSTERRPFDGH